MRPHLLAILILFSAAAAVPAQYAPPAGYYNSATGTGDTLKSQLHNIIDGHTVVSYGSTRAPLRDIDQDPNNSSRIITIYDRGSVVGTDGSAWNREHTWPRSRGIDSSGPDNSDLHMLRPSDYGINQDRGSLNFGGAYGSLGGSYGTLNDGNGTVWYPGDADAGMVARHAFYAETRYDGSDGATQNLTISNGNPGGDTMGDLARMMEWHFAAPPDEFELRRNDRIYDAYQFNRNPFIDHPEWAWSVFVDQQNDSQIAIAGTSVAADGSTTLDLDLGSVLVGGSVPSPQSVTLNKSGLDGTYYEVSTSGAATSSLGGRLNTFLSSQTDSASVAVGLSTSTSTAGIKSGTVTIDNLDITTQHPAAGRGGEDGDDQINVSLSVLDHALPSFDPASQITELTIDFGQVEQDSIATDTFGLFNLKQTIGFTAGLELDLISSSGDADKLITSLMPFTGIDALSAGSSITPIVALSTMELGSFSATYSLSVSDVDLAGASSEVLTLNLLGEVISAALAGDFNEDGNVDAADYTVWRDGLGDLYTTADYQTWRENYGATSGAAGSSVPEPCSAIALIFAAAFVLPRRQR